ncbi:hypothetical protein [Streptomyces althioticus]|uniref:hypothetical protein n=1 Tax=Streptomyces althioticus TaxID=83380 RepID=UPI00331C932A
MTHDFGLHFAQELGNHFGSPTDSWPASAEQMTPLVRGAAPLSCLPGYAAELKWDGYRAQPVVYSGGRVLLRSRQTRT